MLSFLLGCYGSKTKSSCLHINHLIHWTLASIQMFELLTMLWNKPPNFVKIVPVIYDNLGFCKLEPKGFKAIAVRHQRVPMGISKQCRLYNYRLLSTNCQQGPIGEVNPSTTHWAWINQAGVYIEPSPLLSSIFGTGRYFCTLPKEKHEH